MHLCGKEAGASSELDDHGTRYSSTYDDTTITSLSEAGAFASDGIRQPQTS